MKHGTKNSLKIKVTTKLSLKQCSWQIFHIKLPLMVSLGNQVHPNLSSVTQHQLPHHYQLHVPEKYITVVSCSLFFSLSFCFCLCFCLCLYCPPLRGTLSPSPNAIKSLTWDLLFDLISAALLGSDPLRYYCNIETLIVSSLWPS